uniref:SHSP domain-containing protein n=1 Tax=Bracon brevicornis TaxID=1563983 RepID=A0A6V7KX60_9HYME
MSLLPLLYSNWWEDLDHPHSLVDQFFGDAIHPDHLHTRHQHPLVGRVASRCPAIYAHVRPWAVARKGPAGASVVKPDKDAFHVSLDVQQFAPEEITVKVVDRTVTIEGKHDEKQDEHGWISRQFSRRYLIPEQCDIDQVQSKLSSDGVLSIIVPRKEVPKVEGEKTIPIQHTGKPAVADTPKPKKDAKAE